jgi:hypothetical protein
VFETRRANDKPFFTRPGVLDSETRAPSLLFARGFSRRRGVFSAKSVSLREQRKNTIVSQRADEECFAELATQWSRRENKAIQCSDSEAGRQGEALRAFHAVFLVMLKPRAALPVEPEFKVVSHIACFCLPLFVMPGCFCFRKSAFL